jgi:TetR/AcrR family transcriptional regulator, transcriptional repressor for nem operon
MRRSREETAETRRNIVKTAGIRFRQNGICETGLADLMESAGLTHGGFYRHFDSKDQLISEASADAFAANAAEMEAAASTAKGRKVLEAIANAYLSPEHRKDRAHGCPLAALGSELAEVGEVDTVRSHRGNPRDDRHSRQTDEGSEHRPGKEVRQRIRGDDAWRADDLQNYR